MNFLRNTNTSGLSPLHPDNLSSDLSLHTTQTTQATPTLQNVSTMGTNIFNPNPPQLADMHPPSRRQRTSNNAFRNHRVSMYLTNEEIPIPRSTFNSTNHMGRRRISMYLTDQVMPVPPFNFTSIKKSKKEHRTRMRRYLEHWQTVNYTL